MAKAFKPTLVLDSQQNLPKTVKQDINQLWVDEGYGNDYYYHSYEKKTREETNFAEHYPALAKYLDANKIKSCLIHNWW